MSEPDLVSVIVPFRDKADLTNECLRTLAASLEPGEHARVELLLVNNRSSAEELAKIVVPPELKAERIDADVEFNFQTLNNMAAKRARGRFVLLLNNDIIFIPESRGWLKKMTDAAARPDVGAVGPLLYYPDMTIQHAGVVVGMHTYAEHLYRGWTADQADRFPFTAYNADRWVSAVTAAFCMVEKRKFDEISGMDERFIVCGGDVDLCVRLDASGYRSLYLGSVAFIHLESKSRDTSKIPATDFTESDRSYGAFLKRYGGRDPYYPEPLSLEPVAPGATVEVPRFSFGLRPIARVVRYRLKALRRFLRDLHNRMQTEPLEMIAAGKLVKMRRRLLHSDTVAKTAPAIDANFYRSAVTAPLRSHLEFPAQERLRFNVLLPHYNEKGVFAGIITATSVGAKMRLRHPDVDLRFIFVDGEGRPDAIKRDLRVTLGEAAGAIDFSTATVYDRAHVSLCTHPRDHFLTTAWWTCYQARDVLGPDKPFFYLVQDFECGFYPWGDWYASCLATYSMNYTPIFNTSILRDFFVSKGLVSQAVADRGAYFEPAMNRNLYSVARRRKGPGEKRRLFFYGREEVTRNLFPTGIGALQSAVMQGIFDPNAWEFVSAGQPHAPINLGKGAVLRSVGKMSLPEYARFLSETEIGLSLMLSPHPSYPPLEVAAAGALAVTNSFENKDLSKISRNIISCAPSIEGVTEGLARAAARLTTETLDEPQRLELPGNWDEALDPVVDRIYERMRDV